MVNLLHCALLQRALLISFFGDAHIAYSTFALSIDEMCTQWESQRVETQVSACRDTGLNAQRRLYQRVETHRHCLCSAIVPM